MPQFQLAIQGGGARFVDLLVALSVVERFEGDGHLQVTRLAGTSAGSLAAAIYACGPGAVTRTLELLARDGPGLVATVTGGSPVPGWWAMLRAWNGQPLLKTDAFRQALYAILKHAAPGIEAPYYFAKLAKPELFIVASHLTSRESYCYEGANAELVEALINSCALPFAFRSYKGLEENPYVDGGLCENLPSDRLKAQANQYGPVLAISFPAKITGAAPKSAAEYLGELFSTAINNSVQRALKSLPEHAVLSIDTDIDTFEFARAVGPRRTQEHTNIRKKTEGWLQRNLRSRTAPTFALGGSADEIMLSLDQWYDTTQAHTPRRSVLNCLIVTANTLLPPSDGMRHPDLIEKRYLFAPKDEPLATMIVAVDSGPTAQYFGHRVEVMSPEGQDIGIRVLPTLSRTASGSPKIRLLILFEPPLPPMSGEEFARRGCYKLRYQAEVDGGLKPLLDKGEDYIRHLNKRAEAYQRVDLVLAYPRDRPLKAYPKLEPAEGVPAPQPIAGQALRDYAAQLPMQFNTIGWFAQNLAQNTALRLDLYLPRVAAP